MNDSMITLADKSDILKQASQLLEKSNYEEALSILEEYLVTNPQDIEALHLLGTAAAKSGNYQKAECIFKQELAMDPSRADAHFNLGLIHVQQNRIQEALDDYEATIKINPLDAQALNDLGAIYYSKGEVEKGERYLAEALKINPASKEAFLNIFEILWSGNRYNNALTYAAEYLQTLANNRTTPQDSQTKAESIQTAEYKNKSSLSMRKAPPLIRPTESEKIDLFNMHVPERLRSKKTGMNIAIMADFNIAGQITQLFRLINEKTIHRARCIIVQGDYLSYDDDIILSRKNPEDYQSFIKIIENADFFHIGRFPVAVGDFDVTNYLKPNNTIVQYYGSEIRNNAGQIYNWHKAKKITGLSAWDYTMLKDSPLFYHINMMFDSSRVKRAPKPEGRLKIVHPTTNRNIKKTELYLRTIERLQKDNYDIEPVLIEGKTNEECLRLKRQAHMTYDQISVGIYGVSAVESMAAGHVVFGGISNFAASYHPNNPVVWVTEDDLADKIKYYIDHRSEITSRGQAGVEWVKTHHNPENILRQYLYMYDFVKNGHRFLKEPDEQILR